MAAPAAYASASLYVGDLLPDVNEALLYEIFKSVGPVASIRVCRDAITRRSLGYAYVNYHNVADAERALDVLNFTPISGKPCRIMWSHRDPSKRKSGAGNIFIKNLDKTIDNSTLYDTFSTFGNILSCKVELDQNGQSKGYGYVHYETPEEAQLAIAKVNGMLIAGKQVYVGPFKPKKERVQELGDKFQKFTNVYVKNLDLDVSNDQLLQKFSEFGKITNGLISIDETGKSRGFGFINFESHEAAAKAIEEMNGKPWPNKEIFVGRAQKKHEREELLRQQRMESLSKYQGVNLYIKNLDDTIDDDRIRSEFAKFGTITSCKVMRDDKNTSRGFGFVCFTTPEEATRAVTEMNGYILVSKPLYVGLAQKKEVRRAQLEAQHSQRAAGLRIPPQTSVMPPTPVYPNGAPVFFPPGGMPPPQQRIVGYPTMVPRPRYNPNAPQGQQTRAQGQYPPVPGYVVQGGAQRQQPRGPRRTGPQGGPQGGAPQGAPQGQGQGPQGGQQQGGPNQNRNFKYTATARNQYQQVPVPQAQVPAPAPVQALVPATGIPARDLEQLVGTEESKQMIGEHLFNLITRTQPALAGKITGMFLESMQIPDLIDLLRTPVALDGKINEALQVLQEHSVAGSEGDANPTA